MFRRNPFALLALASLAFTAACDSGGEARKQEQVQGATGQSPAGTISRDHAGEAAPELPFTTMDGKERMLSDFEGRPVLVNLWATWCIPCVKELPALQRLADRHGQIALLPIAQDFDGADAVTPFLADNAMSDLVVYLDPDNRWLGKETDTDVLPTSIYYDADGKEVWRVVGELDWDGEQADRLIAEGL
mgnify:CR=1 FL=1